MLTALDIDFGLEGELCASVSAAAVNSAGRETGVLKLSSSWSLESNTMSSMSELTTSMFTYRESPGVRGPKELSDLSDARALHSLVVRSLSEGWLG